MITREAVGSIITHAGPEIGVASRKHSPRNSPRFCSSPCHLGETRGALSGDSAKMLLQEFARIPTKWKPFSKPRNRLYESLARQFFRCTDFLYLGRGIHYPSPSKALSSSKNLLHSCRGLSRGRNEARAERPHRRKLPVVVLAHVMSSDPASVTLYKKSVSNMQEVRARDGIVIAVVTAGDHLARSAASHVITLRPRPSFSRPS